MHFWRSRHGADLSIFHNERREGANAWAREQWRFLENQKVGPLWGHNKSSGGGQSLSVFEENFYVYFTKLISIATSKHRRIT